MILNYYIDIIIPYKYHIVFGFITMVFLILLCCIFFLQKDIDDIKIINRKKCNNGMLIWKYSNIFMKNNYKKDNRLHRVIFYFRNVIIFFLLLTLSMYLYENVYILKIYLNHIQIFYLIGIVVEYLLLILSINITIHKNFNNINDSKTCIFVAFGGADLENKLSYIKETLGFASNVVEPKSVFLLHNGNDLTPKLYDSIKAICDQLCVTYVYIPVPNKSYAIYYAAKHLSDEYDQCLIIDDDVPLPSNTFIPAMKTKIGAYMITSYVDDNMNIYEKYIAQMQGLEYELSGMIKLLQSRWNLSSTTLSHHGAIGLWKRNELIEIMETHDAIFHGEDLMMGILGVLSGYNIKVIEGLFIPTRTPTKIFGKGGLFNQRVKSWDYIVLKFVPIYFKILFFGPLFENFILKLLIINELWTIFIDVQRIPILLYIFYTNSINLSIFLGSVYLLNTIILFWFNYVTLYDFKNKVKFICIITFPIYKSLLLILRLFGELNYLLKYRSTIHRYPIIIKNMPELPSVRTNNESLSEIEWNNVYSNNTYIRDSVRLNNSPAGADPNIPSTNTQDNVNELLEIIELEEKVYNKSKKEKRKGLNINKYLQSNNV